MQMAGGKHVLHSNIWPILKWFYFSRVFRPYSIESKSWCKRALQAYIYSCSYCHMAFERNPIVMPCMKPYAQFLSTAPGKTIILCILTCLSRLFNVSFRQTNGRVQFNMEEPALCVHEHISNDYLYLVVWYCACSWESASHAHGHLRLEACIKSKSYCHTTLEERATKSKGNRHYSFSQVFHPQALAL